jgi:exo-beta-1,3-glucanase (GH17 family)
MASVTVNPVPAITSVSVTCTPATILANQTSACAATLQGTGNFNTAVTWAASAGSITAAGVFTPPAVTTTTTVTITATSVQDSTKSGMASVTVNPVPITLTFITIPGITVSLGQQIPSADLSQYVRGGVPPFTYSLESQTTPDAINCSLNGPTLESDYAYQGGANTVTVKVIDSQQSSAQTTVAITVNAPIVAAPVYGIGFSPYANGQDPNMGSEISCDQITERMGIIAPYTTWIRSFGATGGLECIGNIAHKFGLKVCMQAWISRDTSANANEMDNLIAYAQNGDADCAIIGSEVLLRNDLPPSQLISYINQFRAAVPGIPVTTADVPLSLLNNPAVVNDCDLVFANPYPYWEGKDLSVAVAYLNAEDALLRNTYPNKEVIVAETGWPSGGNTVDSAVPSLDNAAYYFLDFESWARANKRKTFYFEAFDEAWKAAYEGPQGATWGIFDQYGVMKYGSDVFAGVTVADNWTCAAPPGGDGSPAIQFTSVPSIGSSASLQGQVWHVVTADYYVVVYIHVGVYGWWVKPYAASPLTIINCDGTWTTDIVTGGSDASADQIAAFLIPTSYSPPILLGAASLPADLNANAVASVTVSR